MATWRLGRGLGPGLGVLGLTFMLDKSMFLFFFGTMYFVRALHVVEIMPFLIISNMRETDRNAPRVSTVKITTFDIITI